jgi:hypothetical protein
MSRFAPPPPLAAAACTRFRNCIEVRNGSKEARYRIQAILPAGEDRPDLDTKLFFGLVEEIYVWNIRQCVPIIDIDIHSRDSRHLGHSFSPEELLRLHLDDAICSEDHLWALLPSPKTLIEFVLNTGYIYIYQRSCPICSISV